MTEEFDKELEKRLGKEIMAKLHCTKCGNDLVLCPECGEAICPKCIN